MTALVEAWRARGVRHADVTREMWQGTVTYGWCENCERHNLVGDAQTGVPVCWHCTIADVAYWYCREGCLLDVIEASETRHRRLVAAYLDGWRSHHPGGWDFGISEARRCGYRR
jgi:hypothetical protein